MDRRTRTRAMRTREDADFVCTQFLHRFGAKNPAAVGLLASGIVTPEGGTLEAVRLRCGTLPTTSADSFSFQVYADGVALFTSAQAFARDPYTQAFRVSLDDEATFDDYTAEVTGGAGHAPLDALDTAANGDRFYFGLSEIFAGAQVDMDGAEVNAEAAALTLEYSKADGTWGSLSITDGTASGGATLAQDGAITWVPPADWGKQTIDGVSAYWVRGSVDAALSATVSIDTLRLIRDTGHRYSFTPNVTAIPDGAEIRVACTEADANAAGLEFELVGRH